MAAQSTLSRQPEMFSFINKLIWRKDPADTACDEAVDIIRRCQRLSDDERDEKASAF